MGRKRGDKEVRIGVGGHEEEKSNPSLFSCFSCTKVEEEDVEELDFAHCSLDNVPNDIFGFERTLERLNLQCNSIRDLPRPLFQCQELRELDISDNDVQQIPPALSCLHQLVKLVANKNVLTEIPDTIKQLKHLNYLDVSSNPLQKMPEGCTQLMSITELYLNDTYLEFLPANFGRLVKLKILELRDNGLNTLPKSLSRLVHLQRLDLGQNDIGELPEVIGSLTELVELWVDGNRINVIPPLIGNLTKLNHLEAAFNQIETISENIGSCTNLICLSLSTNDLTQLPEAIGNLQLLKTLKLDDNQLEFLPNTIGRLENVEELIVSQNYLVNLPPSIGLCRKMHTLNVDDNDIEYLPKEIGSCISLKILSAHGNRLTSLPAELDHITDLAVVNLTANLIQNLPVSFMKLRKITALWLSENQNKPLIQLNQDTDPETGQKVLTNFMLPQLPDDGQTDNLSESGSFHASVWEEEHAKKSQVKWAGAEEEDTAHEDTASNEKMSSTGGGLKLRREPTPFPKEMRAMAKRVEKLRLKAGGYHQDPPCERKRNSRRESTSSSNDNNTFQSIEIKEARVTKPHASPIVSEKRLMSLCQDEKSIREQIELKQFEELERSLSVPLNDPPTVLPKQQNAEEATKDDIRNPRKSPDKTSRDSGIITPSDGSTTSPETEHHLNPVTTYRKPSDPLPMAPSVGETAKLFPPPYHIAAEFSKQAKNFGNSFDDDHSYENQQFQSVARKKNSSSISDSDQVSETSTAPSSLQTIVRSPYPLASASSLNNNHNKNRNVSSGIAITQSRIASIKSAKNQLDAAADASHANHLRKVSEQLLANPRTRQSVTGIPVLNSRPGSFAASPIRNDNNHQMQQQQSPMQRQMSSRPHSQMSFVYPDNRPGSFAFSTPPPNGADLTPRSMTPASKVSLESNGLLTTIEKVVDSDDEGQIIMVQPNYENVSSDKSKIPKFAQNKNSGDFISTSQFVMNTSKVNDIKMARASSTTTTRLSKLPRGDSRLPVLSPK